MYKVIIVEDDRIIRNSLSTSSAWNKRGFRVAGEAANGEQAIEIIENEQPHIVISDINMPFMNGLEMTKLIKEKSPETRVIFLTGYEEFQYAQTAVKLKAFDFVLKPIGIEQLIEKAEEAIEDWKKDNDRSEIIAESLPLLQQKFLGKLLQQKTLPKNIDMELELSKLGIYLEGPFFSVILINIAFKQADRTKENKVIRNMILSFLSSKNGKLIDLADNEMILLLSMEDKDENRIKQIAKKIFEKLKATYDTPITITMGRIYSNLFEIGVALIESRLAMDLRHIIGLNKVYSINDVPISNNRYENMLKGLDEKLESQIKLGLPEKAKKTLMQLNKIILESKDLPLSETKVIAIKYSTLLFNELEKQKRKGTENLDISDSYKTIIESQSLQKIMGILQDITQEWIEALYNTEDNQYTLVDQAIDYMEKNYSDMELTQKKVADVIYVSAAYLSNLFKVKKGINFSNYLLELRMKKAMEILRSQALKTYEVAEKVGYRNPQYFSISFKKYTSYTPMEYRKKFLGY